jgi:hypothetical protein
MTRIYFHCSSNGRLLPECRVVAVDDLAEARDHAARIVQSTDQLEVGWSVPWRSLPNRKVVQSWRREPIQSNFV